MTAAPLLLLVGYLILVGGLFYGLEHIESSAPRVEDRRAENAAIAFVCAFLLLAMIVCAVMGVQPGDLL